MASVPLVSRAVTAAPKDYTVPGSQLIALQAVQASFTDNGAAGNWLPAVVITSDAGDVMVRAIDPGVSVTAGSNAEVTWFPGVKRGGTSGGLPSVSQNHSLLYQSRHGTQTIGSGAATAITFTGFTSAPGYTPGMFGNPVAVQNPITIGAVGDALYTLVVNWQAAAYDRYIELTVANTGQTDVTFSPRFRESVSPDGDTMVLSAVIAGTSGAPATTITANVFQASGSNKTITAEWWAYDLTGHIFVT